MGNQNTRFMFNNVFRNFSRLWDNEESSGARKAMDKNMAHALCMLGK